VRGEEGTTGGVDGSGVGGSGGGGGERSLGGWWLEVCGELRAGRGPV